MGESTNALTLRSPATKEMYFDYGNMGLFMRNRDALYRTDVYINSAGSVGIGTVNPGVYKCYIAGTGYLNAVAWDCASDVRLKENISYIQSGLNIIEQLKPVKFDYIKGEKRQAGFLAQWCVVNPLRQR